MKLGVHGASGKMGQAVLAVATNDPLWSSRVEIVSEEQWASADAIIDFSHPLAIPVLAERLRTLPDPLPVIVSGTTGLDFDAIQKLQELTQRTEVCWASNFSIGVLVMQEMLRLASPRLLELGFQAQIIETHHRHKKDSPSGTGISLQRTISPEGPGNIPIHSIRIGEIIGEHEVRFVSTEEELRLIHVAHDRALFARGAVLAAQWLIERRRKNARLSGKLVDLREFIAV